ncbi:MAG: hypothetical protein ACHQUC_07360, partial [Chlamydiales bacterium]
MQGLSPLGPPSFLDIETETGSENVERDQTFTPTSQCQPGEIEHNNNPHSCYVAVILNTLKNEHFQNCFQNPQSEKAQVLCDLLLPCLGKILRRETVTKEEVKKIQEILESFELIRLDGNTNQDPMEVMGKILEMVSHKFCLYEEVETKRYDLSTETGREVTLNQEDLGPYGKTIVDPGGVVNNPPKGGISIHVPTGSQPLQELFDQYLNDFSGRRATVYTKIDPDSSDNRYLEYSNVVCNHTVRTFSQVPQILILEKMDLTPLAFENKIQLTTENGNHYYALTQVNCHEYNHEYAFLMQGQNWYLSDDMQPIRVANFESHSDDLQRVCSFGRSFIFKEVNLQAYQEIGAILYRLVQQPPPFHPPVPTPSSLPPSKINQEEKINAPATSENFLQTSEIDKTVLVQLQGLIQICDRLSDSQSDFLQTLLEFSWGVGSLSREKKFSEKWIAVISPRHWILLEDIARQMTNQNLDINLVGQFSRDEVPILVSALKTLLELEQNPSLEPLEVPYCLFEHATPLEDNFDQFILQQVDRNIQLMKAALGGQDPTNWLKKSSIQANETHVKALFRTIEVIGEASKLLSAKVKAQNPLFEGQRGKLWEQLRDKLHHNGKERCWDIAHFATKKWGKLLKFTLSEIPSDDLEKILQKLNDLCKKDWFRSVRRKWNKIKADFQSGSDLSQLLRFLFGFESIEQRSFLEVWKTHVQPHLKLEVNLDENRTSIIEMLRLGGGNFIPNSDIQELMPEGALQEKASVVARVEELLSSISPTNSDEKKTELAKNFEMLVDQLVFLQCGLISTESQEELSSFIKKAIQHDIEKKKELMSLWRLLSQQSQIDSFQLSSATFSNELGQLLESYIKLKHHSLSKCIEKCKKLLIDMQNSWPKGEINATDLQSSIKPRTDNLKNDSKPRTDNLKNDFLRNLGQIQAACEFIKLPQKDDLKDTLKKLKAFPIGEITQYFRSKEARQDLNDELQFIAKTNESKLNCMKAIEDLSHFLNQIEYSYPTIENQVWSNINRAIELFNKIRQRNGEIQQTAKEIKQIFTKLAFKNTKIFITDLNTEKIPHPFTKDTKSCLYSLRRRIFDSLDNQLKTNPKEKIHEVIQEAEELLSISYVQNALFYDLVTISKSPQSEVSARSYIDFLEHIYRTNLDQVTLKLAWENIKRKVAGKQLSAKKEDSSLQKNEEQEGTLERQAITVEQNMTARFQKKIETLGEEFSHLFDLENPSTSIETKLSCLSAEYELQDIGELALKLTARPQCWRGRGHILSSQHLSWLG